MQRLKILAIVGVLTGTVTATFLLAPSNIDPAHKFSWSENAGWMNWLDADGMNEGVVVGSDFLSGYVWMENVGWLNVGDGAGPYANTDGTDFGVNILGNEDLDGMAWGENIGWVNFGWGANTTEVDRARYDSGATRFRGYAWAENAGWINLDDSTHYVGVLDAAPPEPGAGDDTCVGGSNDGGPCSTDADCPGGVCGLKSRYITITPPSVLARGGDPLSIQVTIASMPLFPAREGEVWWAGSSQPVANPPNADLAGAPLVCEVSPSNAEVWPVGILHLFGEPIVPGASYEVRMCDATGANCSDPLVVATGKWGDVVAPFGGGSQPNFSDISSVVDKFRNLASAPDMPRSDLVGPGNPGDPNSANQAVNFGDISADVDAFRGFTYPFTVPSCP